MAYTKTTWVNGGPPPISAENLNNMEDGISIAQPLIGEIKAYAGSTAPDGWLICDGSEISRATYAELFDVIGTTYGSGNGTTTFNIPDLAGKMPLGQSSGHALGSSAGAETVTLTTSEMPSHTHVQNQHRHRAFKYTAGAIQTGTAAVRVWDEGNTQGNSVAYTNYETPTNQNTGGGGAHNNMPPFLTINFLIFAGV